MYIKFLAVLSWLLFAGFLYVIAAQVQDALALVLVLALTALMAGYDFWRDAFTTPKRKNNTDPNNN